MQFTKGSLVVDLFGLFDGPSHVQNFLAVLTSGSQLDYILSAFDSLFLEHSGLPPAHDFLGLGYIPCCAVSVSLS